MDQEELHALILDSWNKPIVFVDTDHVIRYMNGPARIRYAKWGTVIGKSLFECHKEGSCAKIRECYAKILDGAEEVLYADNERHRVYVRRVLDRNGKLIGYYERYEPPAGK